MTRQGDRSDRSGPVVVRSVLDPPGQWSAQQALDLLAQGYSAERVVAVTGLDARWVRYQAERLSWWGSGDGDRPDRGPGTGTPGTGSAGRPAQHRDGGLSGDPETRADLDAYAAGGLTIEEGLDRVRQRVVAAAGVIRSGDGG